MKFKLFVTGRLISAVLLSVPLVARTQTLDITNGIHKFSALTNMTVTMTGRCELWLTNSSTPLSGCTINLNSEDAWLFLPEILPSVAASTYLEQVRVNGANAVANNNVRVVEYAMGAVVIPQPSNFQPLQVFTGPQFTGSSQQFGQYTYYKGTGLGAMDSVISSFKLKRGYMAVVAQNPDSSGISRCYIAQDGDLDVSVLPSQLDHRIRFIYVTPWRWTCKKGTAGDPGIPLLNVRWWYNWNIDQNSTPDLQYLAIRQNASGPGITGQNWQLRGINTLLGFNEPDSSSQANMSVADAISEWPLLLSSGLRVGSPAPTDGGRYSWLYPFVQQADADDLRVDFVAVHYYQAHNPADPSGCASQLYNFLLDVWNHTHRPIWVTEWNNGANWTDNQWPPPTYAQQQADIVAMIQMLDTTPFVERYALYNWVEDTRAVVTNGVLTGAGVAYRNEVSPVGYRQEMPDNGTRSLGQFLFNTNALDSSGYGNNILAVGDPAYAAGPNGQAVVLNGTDNYIQLPKNIASSGSFSFAAWVYWEGGPAWQRIFDFGVDTSSYLFLTPDSGGSTLRFAISTSGYGGEQRLNAPPLAPNTWVHVAVTLNGNNARLYTNGVLAASSSSFSISPATIAPIFNYLGKSQFPVDPLFNGRLGAVQIADYAFTSAQIASLMTDSPPAFTSSILPRGTGTQGVLYNGSIAGTATDPDPGDTLVYGKATGPAWLTVAPDGTLSGTPTFDDSGTNYFTVRVTDAAGASGFAVVTIALPVVLGNGVWISDANGNWSATNNWSGGIIASGAAHNADFSTLNITADRTVTLDQPRSIGTLKFGDTSGGQNWTLASHGDALKLDSGSSASPAIYVNQNAATISAPLTGTNGFAKYMTGTLVLSGSNSLSGTVYIDTSSTTTPEGIVRAAGPGALADVGNIQIRDNNSGSSTLQMDGSLGNIASPSSIALNGRNVNVPAIENLSGSNSLAGGISINVGGGYYLLQSDSGTLNLGGTIYSVASGTRTFTFRGYGNFYVPASIQNGAATVNLIKTGAGTLTLAGGSLYTGVTTVSSGTLRVNGAISTTPVTVANSASLGGTGTIRGPVVIQAGGTLTTGANADSIGTLIVNNSVTLKSGSFTRMKITKSPWLNNNLLRVTGASGTLTYGGTLVLTNLAGTVTVGDTFPLFSATSYAGAFSSITPATPGVGLVWNTNNLAVNGTLSVALGDVSPQFDSVSLLGTNLVFNGSGGAAGADFSILASTNLSLPITNWDVIGNATYDGNGQFNFTNHLTPTSPQEFFSVKIQ